MDVSSSPPVSLPVPAIKCTFVRLYSGYGVKKTRGLDNKRADVYVCACPYLRTSSHAGCSCARLHLFARPYIVHEEYFSIFLFHHSMARRCDVVRLLYPLQLERGRVSLETAK